MSNDKLALQTMLHTAEHLHGLLSVETLSAAKDTAGALSAMLRQALAAHEAEKQAPSDDFVEGFKLGAMPAIRGAEKQAGPVAPTLCRYRCRIKGQQDAWTQWRECGSDAADEFERVNCEQWEYEVQRLYTHPHPTEQDKVDAERWQKPAKRLVQWLHCMSYNDSYFGEPSGYLKQCVNELRHALPPSAIDAARAKEQP